MNARRPNMPTTDAERSRRERRPPMSRAVKISLGVHALLALVLFRMYHELAGRTVPNLQLEAHERSPRYTPSRSFTTTHAEAEPAPAEVNRPAAASISLARRAAADFSDLPVAPLTPRIVEARRATAPAILPAGPVETPVLDDGPTSATAHPAAVAPEQEILARTDTLADWSPRIASLVRYDAGQLRPLGVARVLPRSAERIPRRRAEAFARRGVLALPLEDRTAVDRGLAFLAHMQLDDGRWRFDDLRGVVDPDIETVSIRADAAATGLALLAFLGAGYDHCDGRYHATLADGLASLLRMQQADGELYFDSGLPAGQVTRFYGHGIATLALAEAYGMTGDEKLRRAARAGDRATWPRRSTPSGAAGGMRPA